MECELSVKHILIDQKAPVHVDWAADQPRSGDWKCAVLKFDGKVYSWFASECQQTSNVICQNCK